MTHSLSCLSTTPLQESGKNHYCITFDENLSFLDWFIWFHQELPYLSQHKHLIFTNLNTNTPIMMNDFYHHNKININFSEEYLYTYSEPDNTGDKVKIDLVDIDLFNIVVINQKYEDYIDMQDPLYFL